MESGARLSESPDERIGDQVDQHHLQADEWERIGALFDRLSEQPQDQRRVAELGESDIVCRLLEQMLAAHDANDPHLIDQTLQSVAGEMLSLSTDPAEPVDWTGRRFGPWQCDREIGRGGMALVLKGHRADGKFDKDVAIKLLPELTPAGAQRLAEEIRILARLEHPNIARLIDGDIDSDGQPYLVMELVEGEPINHHCLRHRLDQKARISLLIQVIEAVIHAHRQLVVHCDIKPANILVNTDGQVRLVDFGIAGLLSSANRQQSLARGWFCSPAYAAPEQLAGDQPTIRQDVFSLGAVFYELLTDTPLRNNRCATRQWFGLDQATKPPVPPSRIRPGVDADLDAICMQALASDPDARYPTAEALLADLQRWLDHRPIDARAGGFPYRAGKWLRRNRLAATASAIVFIALVAGSLTTLWQADRARLEAEQARLEANRATTVKDFLLSLFRAGDPLAVGGATLDTRVVLARGAEQIRNSDHLALDIRIEILNTLASVHRTMDWNEDALALLLEARELAESSPELPTLPYAETLFQRGMYADTVERELDQAIELFSQALILLPSDSRQETIDLRARLLIQRGNAQAQLGRLELSEADLSQAEPLLAHLDPPSLELEMILASSRGLGASGVGNYEDGYRHFLRVAELQTQLGNENSASMVMTLSNLGLAASALGKLAEAARYDREAVAIARVVYPSDHQQIGWSLYALGDTLRQMGHLDEARERLEEARTIFRSSERDAGAEMVEMVLARVLLADGQYEAALEMIVQLRPGMERRYGAGSTAEIRSLEVEIAAATLAGRPEILTAAELLAAERLVQLEPNHLWSPLSQQLRWRLATSALARSDLEAAVHWLEQARKAPSDASTHPVVELLLAGLALRLATVDELESRAVDLKNLAELVSRSPTASADARTYAWISIALARHRLGQLDERTLAIAEADRIADQNFLTIEMRSELEQAHRLSSMN